MGVPSFQSEVAPIAWVSFVGFFFLPNNDELKTNVLEYS